MIYFLTSSPNISDTRILNPANHFIENMKKSLPKRVLKALYICSDPDLYEITDEYGLCLKKAFEDEGFQFDPFLILDHRNMSYLEKLQEMDLVVLAGGHVPTQNRFFKGIQLKEKLSVFEGTILGISAGSMNAASLVYAHPNLEGEAASKEYVRFLEGLGITNQMILPHYEEIKEAYLDGLHVIKDIAMKDSLHHTFYALLDGSYILGDSHQEILYGEAYRIQNGHFEKICEENSKIIVK